MKSSEFRCLVCVDEQPAKQRHTTETTIDFIIHFLLG